MTHPLSLIPSMSPQSVPMDLSGDEIPLPQGVQQYLCTADFSFLGAAPRPSQAFGLVGIGGLPLIASPMRFPQAQAEELPVTFPSDLTFQRSSMLSTSQMCSGFSACDLPPMSHSLAPSEGLSLGGLPSSSAAASDPMELSESDPPQNDKLVLKATVKLDKLYSAIRNKENARKLQEEFERIDKRMEELGKPYRVLSLLNNTGTFSFIFKVRDNNGKEYALKIMKELARFSVFQQNREISFLSELPYPYFIEVLDSFKLEHREKATLLPLCKRNLYQASHEIRSDWKQILLVTFQLLMGLALLQKHRIVHCDLKPENVLLRETGRIQIIDLSTSFSVKELKKCKRRIQTETYEDPIVYLYPKDRGSEIDMWSLGCILFELLTGDTPVEIAKEDGIHPIEAIRLRMTRENVGPFTTRMQEAPFYKQHREYIEGSETEDFPAFLRALAKVKFLKAFPNETAQFPSMIDLLTRCFAYQGRITSLDALHHPVFQDYIYFEVIKDPSFTQLVHFSIGDNKKSLILDFSKNERAHRVVERSPRNKYQLSMTNSKGEKIFDKMITLPQGARLHLKENSVILSSVFDDLKPKRKPR